jgi:hypothetical protein
VTQPGLSACLVCGAEFTCDTKAGKQTCWCMDFPHVIPVPVDGKVGCLCPDCLAKAIDAQTKDVHRHGRTGD